MASGARSGLRLGLTRAAEADWTTGLAMNYTITWGGDPEDVCLSARGAASVAELDAMFAAAVSDPRWVEGMKVLLDYTQLNMATLSTEQMQARAGRLTETADAIGRQRIAVVPSSP